MIRLQYYTRAGCHLCELMLEDLLPITRGRAEIELRDIDTRPEWREKYDIRVPVLESAGQVITEYPLDRDAVYACLAKRAESGE